MKRPQLSTLSSLLIVVLILFPFATAFAQEKPSLTDAQIDQRVTKLLQQMTVEEKTGQMMQYFHFLPETSSAEEKARKGEAGSFLFVTDPKAINKIQHAAVEGSRLHIPIIFGFDVIHGWRTIFPVPLAMAASWDPKLVEQVQTVAAREASASGINWTFAPMVDIARDARWGRIIEGAGEDPYLGSAIARAQVRGFQGSHIGAPQHLLATVKHFAAYGAAEGGRDYDATYVPDTLLWNIYFPPYRAAVEAGAGSVMSAYQDLNDVPASGNRWLLHDVLRGNWKFNGFIVSDASAVYSLTVHGYARDPNDAAFKALNAGVNMEMAFPDMNAPADSIFGNKEAVHIPAQQTYITELPALVKAGRISNADLDAMVRPILAAKMKLGLFENPYIDESKSEAIATDPTHRQLARAAAQQTFVLLRNEGKLLPLNKSLKSVAVIGQLANSQKDIMGSWVFVAKDEETVSVLQGIKNKLPGAQITYVSGAQVRRPFPSPVEPPQPDVPVQTEADLQQQMTDAVNGAKNSDVSILVLGELQNQSGEAASRSSLDLPGAQQKVLEAVVAVGKPVVLVLLNGRPLNITWASSHVPAILEAWYPGSEGGNAIADTLFGDSAPAGKLPVTWPRSAGQEPLYYAHNLTQEVETKPDFKSRYWDDSSFPLFPFGYGLSYTNFAFSNLKLSSPTMKADGKIEVSIDVQNTGERSGDEIVQLYIHQQAGSASRPVRQLKGFERITLAAGEKKTITFPLTKNELQYWSPQSKQWVIEPEKFDVWVGEDSKASTHAEFAITK
jgi:beta-glucosidase